MWIIFFLVSPLIYKAIGSSMGQEDDRRQNERVRDYQSQQAEVAIIQVANQLGRLKATEAYENSVETPDGKIVRVRKLVQWQTTH